MESSNKAEENNAIEVTIDGQTGFAIIPKTDCPHIKDSYVANLDSAMISLKQTLLTSPCRACQSTQENWVCLLCEQVFCARYIQGHMNQHFQDSKHNVVFSLSDGSFWCYQCDSYIINQRLEYLQAKFSYLKFGEDV
jgi:uncharacterized UBP type Zn finger protein